MALSLDQFVLQLTDSGLLTADERLLPETPDPCPDSVFKLGVTILHLHHVLGTLISQQMKLLLEYLLFGGINNIQVRTVEVDHGAVCLSTRRH